MSRRYNGLYLLLAIVLVLICVSNLSPYQNLNDHPSLLSRDASMDHPLGSDAIGRDYFTVLFQATGLTLWLATVTASISVTMAVSIALITVGGESRIVSYFFMRLSEAINALPLMPIAIGFSALVDIRSAPMVKIYLALLIIGLISWPPMAIILRACLLKLRSSNNILAARSVGYPARYIYWVYYLPEILPIVFVHGSRLLGRALLAETTLSFLGLGVIEPLVSLGSMLTQARSYDTLSNYPYQWMSTGLMLMLLALSFHLIADRLVQQDRDNR